MIYFVPFSSNTSSSFLGSSRTMPKAGPDHPIDKVIRIAEVVFLSLRKSFITSAALSVTVIIKFPPSPSGYSNSNLCSNLAIFVELSIVFLRNGWNESSFFQYWHDICLG
jgi:hypothetical protein